MNKTPSNTKRGPGRKHRADDSSRKDKIATGGFSGAKLARKAIAKVLTKRGASTRPVI